MVSVPNACRLMRRGDVFVNPRTGERALILIGSGDGQGDRLAALLQVRPGGAVVGEHVHPMITERFRVLRGTLGMSLDGRRDTLEPGREVIVAPGSAHDWWNAGNGDAQVLVEIRPGRRFELMVGTLFGLARAGKTNAKGMPFPLQLAVLGREFADVLYFTKPPAAIQRIMLPPLAALGRARGYRAVYPEYLEPQGREDPAGDVLALLGA